jgi:hypothetical protein
VELLGHVEQYAPDIVARGRRRAIASMQLFCARRALRLGLDARVIRSFLARALLRAPELAVRQPRAVAGLLVAALSPSGAGRLLKMAQPKAPA